MDQVDAGSRQGNGRSLFEHVPIPTWALDCASVQGHIEGLRSAGVQNFRAHFAAHPEQILSCASDIRFLEINQAARAFFGASHPPGDFSSYLSPQSIPILREGLIALANGALTFRWEMPIRDPKGELRSMQLYLTVAEGFEVSLGRVLVSFTDSTELSRAEVLRRAAEHRYRALFQNLLEGSLYGLVLFQGEEARDFMFLDVNAAFETLTGWQDVMGRKASEVIPGIQESNPEFLAFLGRVASRGVPDRLEIRLDTLGLWLAISAHSPEPGYFVAFFQDITPRKHQELLDREGEGLAAKARMAAYVAHEINGPMAGIKSAFGLLKTAIPPQHTYYPYVELVEREIDHISTIVRMMYELHRPEESPTQHVAVATLLQDIATLLAPRLQSQRISLQLDPGEPGLRGSLRANLLRQVFFNLLQNAIEATPPEGTVSCRARRVGENLEIQVCDTGPGIPGRLAKRIWEEGFTTKQDSLQGGMGLGLSTCRRLLETLHGSIDFENPPQGGCIFTVKIPLAWDSA